MVEAVSRPRDSDRQTRVHLSFFDRAKFLLLFTLVFFVLLWAAMANQSGLSFTDSLSQQLHQRWWLLLLGSIEFIRQLHFIFAEYASSYHRIWQRYFAFIDRTIHRLSDWNRYRLSRAIKGVLLVVLLSIVLSAIYGEPPIKALFLAPAALWSALPMLGQLAFAVIFIVVQFFAMFWFLSRGGIDTYFPDDIRTRFSDVWGQDHVLNRIRENLMFLESPEEIEKIGGYVPGGILLWGPPGTGKTLMAEAMAGETGRPFVFVDPGAFNNMFFGVGVLKVKSLFRKLRKLSLRYGVLRRTLGMRPKNPPKYRILVVMATNLPEALDEALLRPGRIDRIYRVGYPSKAGRVRTYKGYLEKVSHLLTDEEIEKLATITPYATGAIIKDTINEALIMAAAKSFSVIT